MGGAGARPARAGDARTGQIVAVSKFDCKSHVFISCEVEVKYIVYQPCAPSQVAALVSAALIGTGSTCLQQSVRTGIY